jgi:hypothetical protein
MKLPDAIHLATALDSKCGVFLSEDLRLPVPPYMKSIRLGSNSLDEIIELQA